MTTGPDGALWFTNLYNNTIGRITTAGVVTNYTGTGIDAPQSITAGPDGALWFTNWYGNSIGRITTAGVVTNYTDTGIDYPQSITPGPDGALWFTNWANNSIGRITTSGVVTNYTGTGIDDPQSITAGPDGALWFTNEANNSIGRITTAGVVTNYTGTGIDEPDGDHHRPDGALWFTNPANNSIGRITTAGVVTNYTGTGIDDPMAITTGPDGALWFTNEGNDSDRADHHLRGGDQLHRHRHRLSPVDHLRARRCPVVRQFRGQLDRQDHYRRGGLQLHRQRHRQSRGDHHRARRGLWFTNLDNNSIGRITTAGVIIQLHRCRHRLCPRRSPPGPTGRSGSRMRRQLDRADHHGRRGHQLHRHWHRRLPTSITTGPDGALWFTNYGNNSIGRITTEGVVTNYTGTGIDSARRPSPPDPTGPCGSPTTLGAGGRSRLDREDHHLGNGVRLHRARYQTPGRGSPPGPTARCGSPMTASGLDRPNHHDRDHLQLHQPPASAIPDRSPQGLTARCGSATVATKSGGSPRPASSPPTPAPVSTSNDITTGPDGALWFTNYDNAIGRVTVPAPALASFSPTSGAVGTNVTITGTALEDASSVTIDGIGAAISKDTATKIKFTVPSGANSGKIEVTTPSGTGVSATNFTVLN